MSHFNGQIPMYYSHICFFFYLISKNFKKSHDCICYYFHKTTSQTKEIPLCMYIILSHNFFCDENFRENTISLKNAHQNVYFVL